MAIVLFLLSLLIRLPAIQNKLKKETTSVLQKQLNCDASIGQFSLGFPKKLFVTDILIYNKPSDTIAYIGEFSIDVELFPLLRKKIVARRITLKNAKGDVGRILAQMPDDSTAEDSGSGSSWEFIANRLSVESSYMKLDDDEKTFELIIDVGKADLSLGSFNFDTLFYVKSLDISNTKVSFETLSETDDTTSTEFSDIRVEQVSLENSGFSYIDSTGAFLFYAGGGHLDVDNLLVDINNEAVAIGTGFSKNTTCLVKYFGDNETVTGSSDLDWGSSLWRVTGDELTLGAFRFGLDYSYMPDPPGHFNPDHMDISDVTGKLTDFVIDKDTLTIGIHNLSAKEKNGLVVKNMDAIVKQDGPDFTIRNLDITTANSKYNIDLNTTISPTDYNDIENEEIVISLKTDCNNWKDIDYFYPFLDSLDILSANFPDYGFDFQAEISGKPDSLSIESFDFGMLDSTRIVANGIVAGASNPDSIQMSLNFAKLMLTKNDLERIFYKPFPDSLWQFPGFLSVEGDFNMDKNIYDFSGVISSNVGIIEIDKLKVKPDGTPEIIADMSADLKELNTIAGLDLDKAVFQLKTGIKGGTIYNANGTLNLNIETFTYNDYDYNNIEIDGEISDGNFGIKLNSTDSVFFVTALGNGSVSENKKNIVVDMDAGNINLKQLNFYDEELKIKSKAVFAVSISDSNNYNAEAKIQSLDLTFYDTLYRMHPADISLFSGDSSITFKLASYFYNLDFSAEDNMTGVINSILNLPGYYLSDPFNDSVDFYLPEMSITGELRYPEAFVRLFFPGYPSFERLTVDGGYNKKNDKIYFNLLAPGVEYNSVLADTLGFSVIGNSKELKFKSATGFRVAGLMSGKFNLNGVFGNSELTTGISYRDTYSNQYLNITMQVDTSEQSTVVHIIPDSLIFSYDKWNMNPANKVIVNDTGIVFRNFELQSDSQMITIKSVPENDPENIELILSDFNLGSLEYLFNLDTVVSGVANADFKFLDLFDQLTVEGALSISDMSVEEFDAGELKLEDFVLNDTLVSGNLVVTGNNEDIVVDGKYLFNDIDNPVDINIDLNRFDLGDLNYLLSDYIKDANGSLRGNLSVTGNTDNPVINGEINFNKAGIGIKSINNYFTFGTETIKINNNNIDFNEFSITNKKNQKAKIVGNVSFGAGNKIYSNLRIRSDNMEIMNSVYDDNKMLFGLLKAQIDVDMKGTPDRMHVNAKVDIDKTSDVTYVFPDDLYVRDNSGIVRFGKFSYDTVPGKNTREESLFYNLESLKNVKIKVDVEDGASFKLFFDKGGSDYLDGVFNGSMNYSVTDGTPGISGMFKVDKGKLHYSIPLVTVEDFTIEPGSYFTMSNDIYNPHLNIIASAKIRAATGSLIPNYDKVMTFKVLLYMIGDLNNIKLKFDISTKTSDAIVSARLAQLTEKERNINALNLLVRGSFVISVHGDEAGSATMLNSQLDKFYTSQLNHLISDNIHFVDLQFDVQSFRDYSSSGKLINRRNFYYNIGKSFIHDRVRITYTGSLGITSDLQSHQVNSNFVQNELEAEIKLTKDGVYRGVLFRKDRYEGLLEGEILETGGGIRIKKNFYSIKDMFTRDEIEKKAKQLEKEARAKKKEERKDNKGKEKGK